MTHHGLRHTQSLALLERIIGGFPPILALGFSLPFAPHAPGQFAQYSPSKLFTPPSEALSSFVVLKRFLALHLSFGDNLTRELLVSGKRTLSAVTYGSKY